jgi:hypothetical protein
MLNYKYTILYTVVSLFLFWLVIKYGSSLILNKISLKEALTNGNNSSTNGNNSSTNGINTNALTEFERYSEKVIPYPKDAVINYNDVNSPLYSHTVNLPINDPISCKNFCGPQAQCAITREQCTSDIDCQGCNPGPKQEDPCITEAVPPYDAGGKLGQQGLQYSPLTTGYNNHNADFEQIYPDSKDAELKVPYQGLDLWTKSFNEGLKLYNKTRESADEYSEGISNAIPLASKSKMPFYEAKYPMTVSATGQFYQTTPPASNSTLSS